MVRRRLGIAGRFMADWKNGATLLGTLLVALIFYVVIDGSIARRDARDMATESAKAAQEEVRRGIDSRQASSARITDLQNRINDLIGQVEETNRLAGESSAREHALAEQLRQLGQRPVVTPRVITVPAPPAPTTTTTTTTRPPTTTTTTRPPASASPPKSTTTTTRPKTTTTRRQ